MITALKALPIEERTALSLTQEQKLDRRLRRKRGQIYFSPSIAIVLRCKNKSVPFSSPLFMLPWQKQELEKRLEAYHANPDEGTSWSEVKIKNPRLSLPCLSKRGQIYFSP